MTEEKEPRRVVNAYCFPDNMFLCFDQYGKQYVEYQGPADRVIPLLQQDYPDLEIKTATYNNVPTS